MFIFRKAASTLEKIYVLFWFTLALSSVYGLTNPVYSSESSIKLHGMLSVMIAFIAYTPFLIDKKAGNPVFRKHKTTRLLLYIFCFLLAHGLIAATTYKSFPFLYTEKYGERTLIQTSIEEAQEDLDSTNCTFEVKFKYLIEKWCLTPEELEALQEKPFVTLDATESKYGIIVHEVF